MCVFYFKVVHIKRFRFSHTSREKLSTDVHFPLTALDLRPFLSIDRPRLPYQKGANASNNEPDSQASNNASNAFHGVSLKGSDNPSDQTNSVHSASSALSANDQPNRGEAGPLQGFDSSSPISNTFSAPIYDLVGVSNHHGSLNGGHYVAHVDTSYGKEKGKEQRWMCFNDARVSNAQPSSIAGPTAYVLFYKLRETESPPDGRDLPAQQV